MFFEYAIFEGKMCIKTARNGPWRTISALGVIDRMMDEKMISKECREALWSGYNLHKVKESPALNAAYTEMYLLFKELNRKAEIHD